MQQCSCRATAASANKQGAIEMIWHDLKRQGLRLGTAVATLSLLVGLQAGAAMPAQALTRTLGITGTPKVGQTLTPNPAGFSTTPTSFSWYTYAEASGGNGAWVSSAATYTPSSSDVGRYIAVYTATDGAILSDRVGPVVGLVKGTVTVSGTTRVGSVLTADTGTWTPTPDSFAYQWLRDGSNVNGATTATYSLTADDLNTMISVKVTASKTDYADESATSAEVGPVTVNQLTAGTPTIYGSAVVGDTLWVDPGSWDPTPDSFSLQWLRNGGVISGATNENYRLTTADLGAKVSVRVTGIKSGLDNVTVTSSQTAAVAATPAAKLNAFAASPAVISSGRCIAIPLTATYEVSTYAAWGVDTVTLTTTVTNKHGKKVGTATLTGSGPRFDAVSAGVSPTMRRELIGTATGTFQWCASNDLGTIHFAAPKGTWTGTYGKEAVSGAIVTTLTTSARVRAGIDLGVPKLSVKGTTRTLTAGFKAWVPTKKAWKPIRGEKVTVQKQVGSAWETVKTVKITVKGKVKVTWKASAPATYRLVYTGSATKTRAQTGTFVG
jgi:hypothetical protein